jgi:uncharacterized protein YfbU (UPF0304 family)
MDAARKAELLNLIERGYGHLVINEMERLQKALDESEQREHRAEAEILQIGTELVATQNNLDDADNLARWMLGAAYFAPFGLGVPFLQLLRAAGYTPESVKEEVK